MESSSKNDATRSQSRSYSAAQNASVTCLGVVSPDVMGRILQDRDVIRGAAPPRLTPRIVFGMLAGLVLSGATGGIVGGLLTRVLPNGVALTLGIAVVVAGFVLSYRWGRLRMSGQPRGARGTR